MVHHAHAADLRAPCNGEPDVAQTQHAQRLAIQVHAQPQRLFRAPLPAFDMRVTLPQHARRVNQQAVRNVRHRVHQHARRVAHRHTRRAAVRHVDVVVADTRRRHHLQLGRARQHRRVHQHVIPDI